ncbi:hypothetical protein ACH41H_06950 [Streptomyces sp. NPDC020800]|uniref:hypothetical protein n=1 Tax=Streptomyces sp. NPDC020800 TaxID=3365092 RepID=UPI00378F6AC8
MKLRRVATATAAALIGLGVIAPAAVAGGNFDYATSRTKLSNGYLYTQLSSGSDSTHMNVKDWYNKDGGGTIRARFAYSYHNNTHYGAWFSQSGGTKAAQWSNVSIPDCQNVVGFLDVSGQGTFYNAPVTGC